MARGRARGFKFSSHPGHGSAKRTAARARNSFKRVSRRSSGGRTKSSTPGFK